MTSTASIAATRAAHRFDWTITAVWIIAGITAAGYLIGSLFDLITLVGWLQPHADVPVELGTGFALPMPSGQSHYSGSPYIADGQTVTVTQTRAAVTGLNPVTIVMLALAPAIGKLTTAAIAVSVARATRALRRGQQPADRIVRMLHTSAALLAIGSTLAQLLQAVANLGLGHIAWNSPVLGDDGSLSVGTTTFSFIPLLATIGTLAAATVLNRTMHPAQAEPADDDH